MDSFFQNKFCIEPKQTLQGDYYFPLPNIHGFDNTYSPEQNAIAYGIDSEEILEKQKKNEKQNFLYYYNRRNIHSDYNGTKDWRFQRFLQGAETNKKITDILCEIAEKGTPFMDLGSYHMGLAPYILHLNPDTPCLITNRDRNYISVLSSCIKENFGKQNINIAFCDETYIPLQRQSLEVVTGVCPLSGASQGRLVDSRVMSWGEMRKWCTVSVLMEVYRVLKPGGCFIFSEFGSNWHFSWTELDDYFEKHDKMYGLYSKDELYDSLKCHIDSEKYNLNDEMIKAVGFDIELKDTYSFKDDLEHMPTWFCKDTLPELTREINKEDDIIELKFTESLYVLRKYA